MRIEGRIVEGKDWKREERRDPLELVGPTKRKRGGTKKSERGEDERLDEIS